MPAPAASTAVQPKAVTPAMISPPTKSTPSTTVTRPAPPERSETPKTAEETEEELAAAKKKEKDKKLRSVRAQRRISEAGEADEPEFVEAFYTTRTFIFSVVIVGAGLVFLIWRNRQRQLLLAATAVSQSPFAATPSATTGGGAKFNSDFLAKLEWKRFEELVADYYAKTGVVATRTKTGPASPTHIKISWKGEPRPFASVACIAHPVGLVDAKPLQDLVAAIATEDIRRGYVVTSGKFSVGARDYGEEKHLTLLPGDIFLEKLNALPEAARNEIMQAVTSGDYQTPSCPKCETKMVKSITDPSQWQCPTHPDQIIPDWR